MSPHWQLVLLLLAAIFFVATGACMAMLSFAIAAYRFGRIPKNDKESKPEIPPAAKFCVYNSAKVAPVISLARRLFFAFAAMLVAYACVISLELMGSNLTNAQSILVFAGATILTIFIQYGIADLPAANFASKHPVSTLRKLSVPFYCAYALFAPIEYPARKMSEKFYAKKFSTQASAFDYIDVEAMLRAEETEAESISSYAGKIVRNAIHLQELDLSDVMLPRSKVEYLDIDESDADNIEIARKSMHTRYPVCQGNLDNYLGVVNIKDILGRENPEEALNLKKLARQTLRFKESDKLEESLAKMLKYRLHMAIVEDEFGGVIGVLTLEAALSELVGEIRDEFDAAKTPTIRTLAKNRYLIAGSTPLRKVEDFLNTDFDTDEVSTFGGLITFWLGRFPEKGEHLHFKEQNLRVKIENVGARAVLECIVQREEPVENSKDNN